MNQEYVVDFLDKLYRQPISEREKILIWTLPDKKSHWMDNTGKILTLAEELVSENKDVYIGVGLAPIGIKTNLRARIDQITGIPAFWADIDFQDPVHVKKNLPTEVEARIFINQEVIPKPTFVIHTGHGFHLWWCLDKVWELPHNDARQIATNSVTAFAARIKDKMLTHKWTMDSTFDLSRVLRLPGTVNFKNEPLDVVIESFSDIYYTIGQLTDGLEGTITTKKSRTYNPQLQGRLKLDPEASPPMDKWMALCENDPRALRSWHRSRKDFDDQSGSAYDLSLATMALHASWDDQSIVDLLIASRRHHSDDLKLREDYYERTLARAKTTSSRNIDKQIESIQENGPESAKVVLSDMLGINIERLVKYSGDPPTYVLEIMRAGNKDIVTLGGVESLIEQRLFRAKVAAVSNVIIPKCTPTQWDKRAQALMNIIEEEHLGPESTPAGQTLAWIHEYLEMFRPTFEYEEALKANRPYIKDGHLHVFLRQFSFWLRTNQGERITNRELARYLKMAGFEQFIQYMKADEFNEATSKSVWRGEIAR